MQSGNPDHMINIGEYMQLPCKLLNLDYFELLIAMIGYRCVIFLVFGWFILIPKGKLSASRRIPTTIQTCTQQCRPMHNYTDLYPTIYRLISLYTTIQTYAQLVTTILTNTHLYKSIHNHTDPYITIQGESEKTSVFFPFKFKSAANFITVH